jgi:hypothetical protein
MKKLLITAFTLCSSALILNAQGFEIGVRGAAASNWLFNSNVDAGGTSSYQAAFSYNYGLQVAYNFSEKVAVEVNLLMGNITQGYSGKFGTTEWLEYQPNNPSTYNGHLGSAWPQQAVNNGETYTASNQVNVTAIPVLFRFSSTSGSYFEIGPEYQMVSSVSYSATYSNGYPAPLAPNNYSNYNVTAAWATYNIQGVIGFGNDFQIGQSGWNIITDIRFYYGFTDLQGNDAHGQYLNKTLPDGSANQLYTANYGGTTAPYYASYKPTHSAGASFNLGIYYFIPIGNTSGRGKCKHAPSVKSH